MLFLARPLNAALPVFPANSATPRSPMRAQDAPRGNRAPYFPEQIARSVVHGYRAFTAESPSLFLRKKVERNNPRGRPNARNFLRRADCLACDLQELRVQFHQVGVKPVVTPAPLAVGLGSAYAQDGEICGPAAFVADLRKLFAKIRRRTGCDQITAVIDGDYRAQHALILGVGLAEVEVRHDRFIIGRNPKNLNGTSVPHGA